MLRVSAAGRNAAIQPPVPQNPHSSPPLQEDQDAGYDQLPQANGSSDEGHDLVQEKETTTPHRHQSGPGDLDQQVAVYRHNEMLCEPVHGQTIASLKVPKPLSIGRSNRRKREPPKQEDANHYGNQALPSRPPRKRNSTKAAVGKSTAVINEAIPSSSNGISRNKSPASTTATVLLPSQPPKPSVHRIPSTKKRKPQAVAPPKAALKSPTGQDSKTNGNSQVIRNNNPEHAASKLAVTTGK